MAMTRCPAGALLAVGITNCSVQDECDPAYALLCESVNHDDPNVRIGAIMGLGLAYCGTQKAEVQVRLSLVCAPLQLYVPASADGMHIFYTFCVLLTQHHKHASGTCNSVVTLEGVK